MKSAVSTSTSSFWPTNAAGYAELFAQFAQVATLLVVAIGLFLAWRRLQLASKQADTDRRRQITDSFAKAVELLGNDQQNVRIGALYALGRIAKDNRVEHWPIMETLAAYIQRPIRDDVGKVSSEMADDQSSPLVESFKKVDAEIAEWPSSDVRVALLIIGRRTADFDDKGQYLSLEGADLRGVRLNDCGVSFKRVDLSFSILTHAMLNGSEFSGARCINTFFGSAYLQNASFRGACLMEARLSHAFLENADFSDADLNGAKFEDAHMMGAILNGASLQSADFSRADLTGVSFISADTRRTDFRTADLSGVIGLTQGQLDVARGSTNTPLPDGLTTPSSWASAA